MTPRGSRDTRPWERLKATQSRISRSSESRTLTTERVHTYSSRSTYQVIQSKSDERSDNQKEGHTHSDHFCMKFKNQKTTKENRAIFAEVV